MRMLVGLLQKRKHGPGSDAAAKPAGELGVLIEAVMEARLPAGCICDSSGTIRRSKGGPVKCQEVNQCSLNTSELDAENNMTSLVQVCFTQINKCFSKCFSC